jgi:hypothetical protein
MGKKKYKDEEKEIIVENTQNEDESLVDWYNRFILPDLNNFLKNIMIWH